MSGAWLGDPESTMCEMGGGPVVDYGYAHTKHNQRYGKTRDMAVKLALQLASRADLVFVCATKAEGERMAANIEALLCWAGVFPVKKYMKKFKVHVTEAK